MRLGTFYRSRLLRWLGLAAAHGRVLDIGGFDGYWAASLAGCEAVAIDVDILPAQASVGYVRGDGTRLPFKERTFDTVYSLDVIEHVPDERPLIAEALRVLRPGGRLVLTTPNETIRIFPAFLQSRMDRQWGHHRVRGFSESHVRGLFEGEALAEVKVTPLAISAFRWCYLPMRLLWALPGPFGRWGAAAAAAWDAGHAAGDRGTVLVEVRR
jgi:SAM-dependent methyltransferase